jgi:hypothetical protein
MERAGFKTLRSERFGARLKQFYVAILLTPNRFPGEFSADAFDFVSADGEKRSAS